MSQETTDKDFSIDQLDRLEEDLKKAKKLINTVAESLESARGAVAGLDKMILDIRQRLKSSGVPRVQKDVSIKIDLFESIEELPIRVRLLNALENSGIRLVWELLNKTPHELSLIKGVGAKSIDELIEALYTKGYIEAPTREALFKRKRQFALAEQRAGGLEKMKIDDFPLKELPRDFDVSIEALLPISGLLLNSLFRSGLETMRDLLRKGPDEKIYNVGKKSLKELLEALYNKGYIEAPTREAWRKKRADIISKEEQNIIQLNQKG